MDHRIEQTLFFIEQHINSPICLDALASDACLSPFHFHRLFKQETGETPKTYIARVRLEHIAHMMIIRRDISITELAFEYGYSSPAAFTRAFRTRYKQSPRDYRDHMRNLHKNKLEAYWQELDTNKVSSKNTQKRSIKVEFMAKKRVNAIRTTLDTQSINAAVNQLVNTNTQKASHALIIYPESPFHHNRQDIRAYVALDKPIIDNQKSDSIQSKQSKQSKNIIELAGGYYHQVPTGGNFDQMLDQLFQYFQMVIEPSKYKVASTTFYEQVSVIHCNEGFDYDKATRTVFAKLAKR